MYTAVKIVTIGVANLIGGLFVICQNVSVVLFTLADSCSTFLSASALVLAS